MVKITDEQLKAAASNNLKHIREKLNLTQQQFADQSGIKRHTIGAVEDGRACSLLVCANICEFAGISLDEFVRSDMSKTKSS